MDNKKSASKHEYIDEGTTQRGSDSSRTESPEHVIETSDSSDKLFIVTDPESPEKSPEDSEIPEIASKDSVAVPSQRVSHFYPTDSPEIESIDSSNKLVTGPESPEQSPEETGSDDHPKSPLRSGHGSIIYIYNRVIREGSNYQAVIPKVLSEYNDDLAYKNEDKLLWQPFILSDEEVVEFLRECNLQKATNASGIGALPTGCHVRDDEVALYLLLQCNHNKEEALKRLSLQLNSNAASTSSNGLWSEDECRSFEDGITKHGKNFRYLQQKVKTKTVSEIVQFYYFWKKTERGDAYSKVKRTKKNKFTVNPGTTDYMDSCLDDKENRSDNSDRIFRSKISGCGKNKKRTSSSVPETIDFSSAPETTSTDSSDASASTSTFSTGNSSDSFPTNLSD